MTEEIKPVEGTEQAEQNQVVELTETEKRAMEMGWRPKAEFDGDEDSFIDAKEFVRRKPLFDKIETQSKEIKNVRKAIEALQQHYTAREAAAVEQALTKLRTARQTAISDSDGEIFEAIDTEIKRVEKESERLKKLENQPIVQQQEELHPEFQAWTSRNRWYNDTQYMRAWADEKGVQLAKQGMTPSEVLRAIEKDVKAEFPQKFVNPNKSSAPNVEGGSRSGGSGAKNDGFELTEQERKIMNTLVASKTMTKEKYLEQLKAIKEVK
jgi:hypothetical protein